jgi:hypothetical protein
MAKKVNRSKNKSAQEAYLSKRTIQRATRKASAGLNEEAMITMGYVVRAEGEWVIKVHDTGKEERIERIVQVNTPEQVVLD